MPHLWVDFSSAASRHSMGTVEYDPENGVARWIAYFDLLGTSVLLETGKVSAVFSAYAMAVERLKTWKERYPSVTPVWFSDSRTNERYVGRMERTDSFGKEKGT